MKSLWIVLSAFLVLSNAHAQSAANTEIIYLNSEENRFYQMLNQFRVQLNLPELQMHVYLQNAAKKHSEWMNTQGFLTHYGPVNNKTPFQRMEEEGYVDYTFAGENIACGNGDAAATFRQWATSPKHLSNMVSPHFRHVGISRAGTGKEYCPYYWTNDFGSFTAARLDPPEVTDVMRITRAAESVAGSLNGVVLQLPVDENRKPTTGSSGSTPAPVPAPTPAPPPAADVTLIQCMVPNAYGRGLLTTLNGTDTIIEATRTANGYNLKLSYIQNGQISTLAPFYIYGVSVVKNASFPLYTIFAAPGARSGFSIQFNTATNQAQFEPYASAGTSGSILCSLKVN